MGEMTDFYLDMIDWDATPQKRLRKTNSADQMEATIDAQNS